MRKFLPAVWLLVIGYWLLVSPPPVFAQKNITGINLAGTWDTTIVSRAAQIVGPGGWLVLIATPGDCGKLQEVLNSNPGVNIIVRPWKGPYAFGEGDARAWVATLGHLQTSQKIYLMPWNEPNGPHLEVTPKAVKSYTDTLANYLAQAGLRPGRVALLSPMINQFAGNYLSYVAELGGGSYFRQFDGITMNLYDNEKCGGSLCEGSIFQNASKFNEILAQIGASGMSVFAVESGVVVDAPRYLDNELKNFFAAVYPHWQGAGNFVMGSVFATDPEHEDPWDIFGSQTAEFFRTHRGSGPVQQGAINQAAFNQWFGGVESTLVSCGACGYAPTQDFCQGISGGVVSPRIFNPSRMVQTTDVAPSIADAVKFSQSGELAPYEPKRDITRAGFFEEFADLTIPFARDLTRYLAGPFLFQGNTVINNYLKLKRPEQAGVLSKLTASDLQDKMRRDYWEKCNNGTYCSNKNIGTENCPTVESNECIIADGTDIYNITPPPDPTNPIYQNNKDRYLLDLSSWQKIWGFRWAQVPLVSNPKTFVKGAIRMASCDAGGISGVDTKTPWVSGLKDVSVFLANLLLSGESGAGASARPSGPKLLASQEAGSVLPAQTPGGCPTNFYVQIENSWTGDDGRLHYAVRITHTAPGTIGDVLINPNIGIHYENIPPSGIYLDTDMAGANQFLPTYPAGTDPNTIPIHLRIPSGDGYPYDKGCQRDLFFQGGAPPPGRPAPVCRPPEPPAYKPDGTTDPVEVSGHALLTGPSETLRCDQWGRDKEDRSTICLDPKGNPSATLDSPVWPVVDYPYLNTIYNKLAGPAGIFQAIFKPAKMQTEDWNWAGESGLNYCLSDVQKYASIESWWGSPKFLKDGGLYPYSVNFKAKAMCSTNESTQNLRVYPEKIGGVKNAQEWVIKELNP